MSLQVTARSSRPSPSKSSMIAPPDWLKRFTPTLSPTSRNLPMSNSECVKRSSEIRYRGSTCSGCSPSVMWARFKSHFASRSSGNRAEILREMLDRQPRAHTGLV